MHVKMHPLDLSPTASSISKKCRPISLEHRINSVHHAGGISNKTQYVYQREKDQGKRGRPRADILTTLMVEGSSSRSRIRCTKCSRVFPREKSLQAHLRTHTEGLVYAVTKKIFANYAGERPYTCDYPNCTKAFCQSGQLKTHQRLHTGEKPFSCIVEGCPSRFTHANRHCTQHPFAGLKRMDMDLAYVTKLCDEELNPEIKKWISKYIKQCNERINPKCTLNRSSSTESMEDNAIRDCSLPPIPISLISKTQVALPQYSGVYTSSRSPPTSSTSALTPRQMSVLSCGSSSSGVSSISSSCASPMPFTLESRPEASNFIYSSQMILQGQYNDVYQMAHWASRASSPATGEMYLTNYRAGKSPIPLLPSSPSSPSPIGRPSSPIMLRPPTPPLLKPLASSVVKPPDSLAFSLIHTQSPPLKPIPIFAQPLKLFPINAHLSKPIDFPAHQSQMQPLKPIPTNAYPYRPIESTAHQSHVQPLKPIPTNAYPSRPIESTAHQSHVQPLKPIPTNAHPSTPIDIQVQTFRSVTDTEAFQNCKPFACNAITCKPTASTSPPVETTDSISYRTTPKNREKDRYISALALIELSKGEDV